MSEPTKESTSDLDEQGRDTPPRLPPINPARLPSLSRRSSSPGNSFGNLLRPPIEMVPMGIPSLQRQLIGLTPGAQADPGRGSFFDTTRATSRADPFWESLSLDMDVVNEGREMNLVPSPDLENSPTGPGFWEGQTETADSLMSDARDAREGGQVTESTMDELEARLAELERLEAEQEERVRTISRLEQQDALTGSLARHYTEGNGRTPQENIIGAFSGRGIVSSGSELGGQGAVVPNIMETSSNPAAAEWMRMRGAFDARPAGAPASAQLEEDSGFGRRGQGYTSRGSSKIGRAHV